MGWNDSMKRAQGVSEASVKAQEVEEPKPYKKPSKSKSKSKKKK